MLVNLLGRSFLAIMKTKKFTLSKGLEILYTLYYQMSNVEQEQAREIA
jgi:hypothetical protein